MKIIIEIIFGLRTSSTINNYLILWFQLFQISRPTGMTQWRPSLTPFLPPTGSSWDKQTVWQNFWYGHSLCEGMAHRTTAHPVQPFNFLLANLPHSLLTQTARLHPPSLSLSLFSSGEIECTRTQQHQRKAPPSKLTCSVFRQMFNSSIRVSDVDTMPSFRIAFLPAVRRSTRAFYLQINLPSTSCHCL